MPAPKGNKNNYDYKPDIYPGMARRYFLLNKSAVDKDLAKFFEVSEKTIYNWKRDHPEFKAAIREGKEEADSNVAEALYNRAVGYSHPAVKIFGNTETGKSLEVPYVEHYPPDTTAAKLWLTNRSKEWKDKQVVGIEDADEILSRVLSVAKEDLPE